MKKLAAEPFSWKNAEERKLIARYVVEDNGPGFMLEDLYTRQSSPIIKSVLGNIIGGIKVYEKE